MKKANLEKHILQYLETVPHCVAWVSENTKASGTPTIVACVNGSFHAFEVMTDDESPSIQQEAMIKRILSANGAAMTVYSVDEVRNIIEGSILGYGICKHCGRFFQKISNRQLYCQSKVCQNARNANNQRRRRKRLREGEVGA